MTKPRIGVCQAPQAAANLREIVSAATGWCEPVLLIRARVADTYPDYVRTAARILETHVLSPGSGVARVRALALDGLTTFHDDELELINELNGHDSDRRWDKYTQRRLLAEAGIGSVRAVPVDSDLEFLAAINEIGLPCVLKPRRGSGGAGIAFVRAEEDARHQVEHRRSWSNLLVEEVISATSHPSGVPWLADYVSVETISVGSTRRHLAILDKLPVSVTNRAGVDGADLVCVTGDVYPSSLPAEFAALAMSTTDRVLDALGVRSGMTHTELKITDHGFELIEVNGRLAGHTSRLTRLVGGPDLVRAALQAAVGVRPAPTAPNRGVACGMFPRFRDRSGLVRSAVERKHLRALPGVRGVDEVAAAGTARERDDGRVANISIRADSWPVLEENLRSAARALRELFHRDDLADEPFTSLGALE
jgi:biotin carboxylase